MLNAKELVFVIADNIQLQVIIQKNVNRRMTKEM